MRIAAAYYRVSTQDQDLERQYSKVEDFARKNDYKIIKVFEDKQSGKTPDRASFQALQDWMRENPGTTILAAELDRISRGLEGYVQIKLTCKQYNVELKCLNVSKTGNVASDALMEGILASFAEYDRINVLSRFMSGRLSKLRSGIPILGRAAYGYRYIPKSAAGSTTIIVDPVESLIVKEIFDLFVNQDTSIRAISRILTKRGVQTKQGFAIWHPATLRKLLVNQAYIGKLSFKEANETIDLTCPAIIDEALFEKAQYILKNKIRQAPNRKNEYLLSGLLICSECGTKYSGYVYSEKKNASAYRCNQRSRLNKSGDYIRCGNQIFTTKLDGLVWAMVLDIVSKFVRGRTSNKSEFTKSLKHLDEQIKDTGIAMETVKPILERVTDSYIAGSITHDDYLRNKVKYEKQVDNYKAEISRLLSEQDKVKQQMNGVNVLSDLKENLKTEIELHSLTYEQKQVITREVIGKIVVLPKLYHFEIHYNLPYPFIAKLDASEQLRPNRANAIDSIHNSKYWIERMQRYNAKLSKKA